MQKQIVWNEEKNQLLKLQRGFSFDDVLVLIEEKKIIARKTHPNKQYVHQEIFVVCIKGYICYVPFVEDNEKIFLKTIIPSRKLNKVYGEDNEK